MWIEKFKANLAMSWHYASAWVVAVFSAGFSVWATLDAATQAQIAAVLPFGKYLPALGLFVAYFAAKGWPQPKLETRLATQKAAEAEVDLDPTKP